MSGGMQGEGVWEDIVTVIRVCWEGCSRWYIHGIITMLAYYILSKRKWCDSRVASDVFRLGCGYKISKVERRVPCSDVSQNVLRR